MRVRMALLAVAAAALLSATPASAGSWELLVCGTEGWAEAVRDGGEKVARKYVELERCEWVRNDRVEPTQTHDDITMVFDLDHGIRYAVDDMQRKAKK